MSSKQQVNYLPASIHGREARSIYIKDHGQEVSYACDRCDKALPATKLKRGPCTRMRNNNGFYGHCSQCVRDSQDCSVWRSEDANRWLANSLKRKRTEESDSNSPIQGFLKKRVILTTPTIFEKKGEPSSRQKDWEQESNQWKRKYEVMAERYNVLKRQTDENRQVTREIDEKNFQLQDLFEQMNQRFRAICPEWEENSNRE